MADDRDRELDRCIAESEIRNLIARLGHLADDGGIEEYLALWAEDGSWTNTDGARFTGHDELRKRIDDHRDDGTQGPGTNSRHLNTTLWITIDDDCQHAAAESYYLYLRNASEVPQVASTGRYNDRFIRTSDGWKYVERKISRTIN